MKTMEVIDELKKSSNSAIIMISHDLGVVAKLKKCAKENTTGRRNS